MPGGFRPAPVSQPQLFGNRSPDGDKHGDRRKAHRRSNATDSASVERAGGSSMSGAQREEILAEAARWFARLRRGVMTVEARAEYDVWSANPENAPAMEEIERAWVLIGLTNADADEGLARRTRIERRTFARTALLALMCVVSLGLGVVSYSGHSSFWTKLDWVER